MNPQSLLSTSVDQQGYKRNINSFGSLMKNRRDQIYVLTYMIIKAVHSGLSFKG